MAWQGALMGDLYARMGWLGFVPPPQRPPRHTSHTTQALAEVNLDDE